MSAPRVQVYAARVVHLPPAQFAAAFAPRGWMRSPRIGHPDAQAASLTGDLLLCAAVRRACPGAPMPLRRASAPGGKPGCRIIRRCTSRCPTAAASWSVRLRPSRSAWISSCLARSAPA